MRHPRNTLLFLAMAFALLAVAAVVHAASIPNVPTPTYAKLAPLPPENLNATGCRHFDGTRVACDTLSAYCSADPVPGTYYVPNCDIDGQPRYEPYAPVGCPANTRADIGADEAYAPGCEPLINLFGAPSYCPGVAVREGVAWSGEQSSSAWKTWAAAFPKEVPLIKAYHNFRYSVQPPVNGVKSEYGKSLYRLLWIRAITGC